MTRYVLAARLGTADNTAIEMSQDERLVEIDYLDDAGTLRHGVGRALRDLKKLGLFPDATSIDLLVFAVLMYAADTRINRAQTSQDNWTREIRLVVPVSDPARWSACSHLLCRMLRFLTGDLWQLTFRQWPPHLPHPGSATGATTPAPFDCVSLFSGGLDSLIGAIDSLESGQAPLFASHGGDGSVSSPQSQLFAALGKLYAAKTSVTRLRMAMRLESAAVPGVASEESTRGRSFLFFALGTLAGSALGKPMMVRVPENGLISLNVPLDATRLGSNSTRTTHPFYIHRWNELLKALGIPCTIHNPYWDRTKGEMLSACINPTFLKTLAPMSVSCAHPSYKRYAQDSFNHCGTCVPCIIRRASFASSPIADPTEYRIDDISPDSLDFASAQGQQIRAFEFALDRLHDHPDVASVLIHKPGPLMDDLDKLAALAGVYVRGMGEVRVFLQSTRGKH